MELKLGHSFRSEPGVGRELLASALKPPVDGYNIDGALVKGAPFLAQEIGPAVSRFGVLLASGRTPAGFSFPPSRFARSFATSSGIFGIRAGTAF